MTQSTTATESGLRIVGAVGLGFPPPQGGYASVAYNNAQPGVQSATWLVVRPDGAVTAYAGKVEYGQGIRSGLAIEVADELGVAPAAVEVVLGDTDLTPWDMGTFGSQSTARAGVQLRKAAATARQALLQLGASRLDLPESSLVCRRGRVESQRDPTLGVTWGELLREKPITRQVMDDALLKAAKDFTVMGRPVQRVDAVARVTGQAKYSQDITVPGMLFTKILRPPSFEAKLRSLDTSIAKQMPGVADVIRDGDLVAVLATSEEEAEAALRVVRASWEEKPDQPPQWAMPEVLLKTAREFYATQEAGSLDEGFRAASATLEETYSIPYVSTNPMEPRAAVAEWSGDKLTVWAGTQRPFGVRQELAAHFGIPESRVRVIAPEIGGGFGAKSIYPVALDAARLARAAGRPVRIAHTRAEEMTWNTFRPAALITIKSGFKSDGTVVAWDFRAIHAGPTPFIGRRESPTPYNVPNVRVAVGSADSPLRAGSYRSLGAAVNHFARESHMDEIAAAVGRDPVDLRLHNLTDPRFRRVLTTAAERFGWPGVKLPSQRGVGVAVGLDVGTYIAECVQLDVQGAEVKVSRVAAAMDCGLTVNPEGARNQVEGAIVMGMGTALYEAMDFQAGRVLNAGFARYRVPRSTDVPAIDVALVGDATTPSTGAGEPGIVPIAAAIANAVFDRTGKRIRELPLQRYLR